MLLPVANLFLRAEERSFSAIRCPAKIAWFRQIRAALMEAALRDFMLFEPWLKLVRFRHSFTVDRAIVSTAN